MRVEKSTRQDIDEIFRLYTIASANQQSKNFVVWPTFERSIVEAEIAEHRQFKLIVDEEVAWVWAITCSDRATGDAHKVDQAMYIHCIAINPNFGGMNLVGMIIEWAKEYARAHGKDFERIDLLGDNRKLIEHHTQARFEIFGDEEHKGTAGISAHYKTGEHCLQDEIKL